METKDYQEAENYWVKKDQNNKKMDVEPLKNYFDQFLLSHNTGVLGTGYNNEVRCTPIEYTYYNHSIYLISEGGRKFHYLKDNPQVSFAIYENYQGFHTLNSCQIQGVCSIIDFKEEEYKDLLRYKKIPLKIIESLDHPMYLLKIEMNKVNLLVSDFKKDGFSSRQEIIYE